LDTLRESNMDPNETAQKLLNQGLPPLSLPCYPPIWVALVDLVPHRELGFWGGAPSCIGSGSAATRVVFGGAWGVRCTA